ncbi:M20 family metallopeptidase [Microbacterium sp. JAI119]|uniref:M20 family metallopeptidase n=1 Tax=Microbacterium sp. JAI119 TaxID=2723062 RepID=UPI0015CD344A|nr:M20/M25/M40 family metallo-hydrolase [Microbacterium sp. JAI119]NYF28080.1 succinyl-diaminopimelate desuccinylase [Microbacterium sp. JAI119]
MREAVVALASQLIRTDTAGHGEEKAVSLLAPLLAGAGFDVSTVPWSPERTSLVASWNGGGAFVLSGHVDTVPYGDAEWKHGPLSADQDGDRLFGRGSSDMKGGVAAIVLAATAAARRNARGFTVVLTAGEETGCGGAQTVLETGLMQPPEILIVGESTSNAVRLGHKGASWFEVTTSGLSAHGSRPDLGVNAIEPLADAITALRAVGQGAVHAELGARTTSVGTIRGGSQTNLVPDHARMTVDVRPVPGAPSEPVRTLLERFGRVDTVLELPAVWSPTESPVTQTIVDLVAAITGRRDEPRGVSYFTDAAVLDPSLSRSYIVGPGDPDQPHTTNESVSMRLLEQAVSIYDELLDAWDRKALG